MENGDWRVAVQGVERVRGDIENKMRQYLSPTVTGEYRVTADASPISQSTRLTVATKLLLRMATELSVSPQRIAGDEVWTMR